MKRWLSLLLFAILLVACSAPTAVTNTPFPPTATATEAPTAIPTEIPSTVTALPPTETPVVKVELDKPMTTEFSPLNIEAMPTTNSEMVTSGQLGDVVRQYWQETGLINPDGSVNKPENVVATKPDQWSIFVSPDYPEHNIEGGDEYLIPKFDTLPEFTEYPFQPTNLLFKVTDGNGKTTGILVTETLFYEDDQGQVHVTPVFFFIDQSKLTKTYDHYLHLFLGHPKEGDKLEIAIPYVGLQDGKVGNPLINYLTDKITYLNEPMQSVREDFAHNAAENHNPQGIDKFWWAVSSTILGSQ